MKYLWVLAGANGSGKSTFYQRFLKPKKIAFVNADEIAKRIDPDDTITASIVAAAQARELRKKLMDRGESFCFETVFSHPSKVDELTYAKAAGYKVIVLFFVLASTDLNKARVSHRVSKGGHPVPEDKIVSRAGRVVNQLRGVIPFVDEVVVFDNSVIKQPYKQLLRFKSGQLVHQAKVFPIWARDYFKSLL